MDSKTLSELTRRVADVIATDGGELLTLEIVPMADGSGRWCGIVTTHTAGLEQVYRVSTPAPAGAPAWARTHDEWATEVRVVDKWTRVDDLVDEAGPSLMVCVDGVEHADVPLIDGDDAFNREAERGALDRAYEAKESNPDAVVTIVVCTAVAEGVA
jgi:hypothetical protein